MPVPYPAARSVLGWASFAGRRAASLPSVQDLPHVALISSVAGGDFSGAAVAGFADERESAGADLSLPDHRSPGVAGGLASGVLCGARGWTSGFGKSVPLGCRRRPIHGDDSLKLRYLSSSSFLDY